jgi:hypothetical protein
MAVSQPLPIGLRDAALPCGRYVTNHVLATDTAETVTVPAGAAYAFFSFDGDFWRRVGGTAAVPTTEVVDGTGVELNPTWSALDGVTSFSIVAGAARKGSITWYLPAGRASA